jgi:hypothetical protein
VGVQKMTCNFHRFADLTAIGRMQQGGGGGGGINQQIQESDAQFCQLFQESGALLLPEFREHCTTFPFP